MKIEINMFLNGRAELELAGKMITFWGNDWQKKKHGGEQLFS
jgi:hypothetical protein